MNLLLQFVYFRWNIKPDLLLSNWYLTEDKSSNEENEDLDDDSKIKISIF